MEIAYLINQYPKVSHSFIRREILGLERHGVNITRVTIRKVDDIVDDKDKEEQEKTICILDLNPIMFCLALLKNLFKNPFRFFKVCHCAVKYGKMNNRGVFRHLIYFAEACAFKDICLNKKIDHVHAHFGTNTTTVVLLAKMLGGPGYSFTVHGPEEFDSPRYLALEDKINHSRFVCAISSFGRSQLMRWCHPAQWDKIKIIHCAVEEKYFDQEDKPFINNKFVCVGRLAPQKGPVFLMKAVKELKDEGLDIQLVFAGDGDLREIVDSYINSMDLASNVRVTGWLSSDEVREELQSSRALVLPSFAEGLPVVIMEALALKRPVISTYVAGIPELVDDKCGILIPAGSVEYIKDAIKVIMNKSEDELKQMGQVGYARVFEQHNPLTESGKLLDFINNAVKD
jgi:glycosyltransferase involved in cell wall biosynthesis